MATRPAESNRRRTRNSSVSLTLSPGVERQRPRKTRLVGSAADGTLAGGLRGAEQDVAGAIGQAQPRANLAGRHGRAFRPTADERGRHRQSLDTIRRSCATGG